MTPGSRSSGSSGPAPASSATASRTASRTSASPTNPASSRTSAATAARLLLDGAPGQPAPWSTARVVVREVQEGLSAAEVAAVTGRPVVAGLPHDRGAVGRGERGEPPAVSPRSPLGSVARRLLVEPARPGVAA